MNAADLKKLTTDSLEQVSALLDGGYSEHFTALLKTMARFRRYSLHNVYLIASQRPTATRVAGFRTWLTLGRCVRRGEKALPFSPP